VHAIATEYGETIIVNSTQVTGHHSMFLFSFPMMAGHFTKQQHQANTEGGLEGLF